MSESKELGVNPETAIARAKRELAEEKMAFAVKQLKSKLKELDKAKVIVANVEREVEDLEQAIRDGNA